MVGGMRFPASVAETVPDEAIQRANLIPHRFTETTALESHISLDQMSWSRSPIFPVDREERAALIVVTCS